MTESLDEGELEVDGLDVSVTENVLVKVEVSLLEVVCVTVAV